MDSNDVPEITTVASTRVFCDGDEHRGDGHPRVWLQIGDAGFADCSYCDRRFVLAADSGAPADH